MLSRALIIACTLALACARSVSRDLQVLDRRPAAPAAFTNTGKVSPDTMLNLRLQLVQRNIAGLQEALMDVSTPGNAKYGQHLSNDEVADFVAPAQDSVDAVTAWLKENGIDAQQVSPAGDWLSFSVPVSKANEMLDASFEVFEHNNSGVRLVRTLSYSVPADLQGHLALVHPTTSFGIATGSPSFSTPSTAPSNVTSEASVPSSCNNQITPSCLQALYGIPKTSNAIKSNVLAVSGYIDQFAQKADLQTFLQTFRSDLSSSTTFTLQTLDGGEDPQGPSNAGVEANLDIQYTIGVASKVPVTFISVGESNQDGIDGFLDLANFVSNMKTPPTVLTTSYGFNEPDLPASLAQSLCNAYMQLGARGTSVLYASGDGGVSGSQSQDCDTFIPTFPSTCPYVTSVGATTGTTETAADFSSGGFSTIFSQPSYQSSAVSGYLSHLGNTNQGKFNRTGRAFPDVSAQGKNVAIVVGGDDENVDGTSCSSPIFASVIALLNDELAKAGKSPLGFLNPLLYSSAGSAALNDVTSGSNPGCNTNGFPAASGWDPVTGLGTPNYGKLRKAVGL